jgi:shikimate kinase
MGTGKTTVGQLLAERLGIGFIDLDAMISESAGATITEIFETQGEERFREIETELLSLVAGKSGSVVATGGGVVLREVNRLLMGRTGVVVNLHASREAIFERISGDTGRPLLDGGETADKIDRLFSEREHLYLECHTQIYTTGKSPEVIVDEILAWLKTEIPRCEEPNGIS